MPPPSSDGRRPRVDLTLKISLAGDPGVGKTSLTRRFVSNTFDETYIPTLGTKVSSREFHLDDPAKPGTSIAVGATLWDIMGNHQFRDLLREAFFVNASGVLLVCDVTRPETVYNLPQWYEIVASVVGTVPTVVISGDTTPRAKPHPDPLLEAARRAGVAPERCIYVGDDLRDVQAGRAAGMATLVAAWGYLGDAEQVGEIHEWQADAVLHEPAALLKWLGMP